MKFTKEHWEMRHIRSVAAVCALAGVGFIVQSGGLAVADEPPATQPDIVEDFEYPSRDAILAERHIKLLKGNGVVMLADCDDNASQIVVTRNAPDPDKRFCFTVAKKGKGFVSMELDKVFLIGGADRNAEAKITVGGRARGRPGRCRQHRSEEGGPAGAARSGLTADSWPAPVTWPPAPVRVRRCRVGQPTRAPHPGERPGASRQPRTPSR
jgi:hypothetical protein